MAAQRRVAGGLEAEVLGRLWQSDSPMTVGDLVVDLGGSLAYNTVQTILIRLLAKNAVTRESVGRAHAYTAVLDEAGMAAHRMRDHLRGGRDAPLILAQFVDALTPAERSILNSELQARSAAADGPLAIPAGN